MKEIILFEARDGTRFGKPENAIVHEALLDKIDAAMKPLTLPDGLSIGMSGWAQHSEESVISATNAIRAIQREYKIPWDVPGVLTSPVLRLNCIDHNGREFAWPHHAYHGPEAGMICLKDLR